MLPRILLTSLSLPPSIPAGWKGLAPGARGFAPALAAGPLGRLLPPRPPWPPGADARVAASSS